MSFWSSPAGGLTLFLLLAVAVILVVLALSHA